MKEVCGVARNLLLVPGSEQPLIGLAEVVVMTSEPEYRIGVGSMERYRTTECFRFTASPKALRGIAEDFVKYADEIEALEAQADGKQAQL